MKASFTQKEVLHFKESIISQSKYYIKKMLYETIKHKVFFIKKTVL